MNKKNKKANPILLLLHWAGTNKFYLLGSILCAMISGLSSVIPYYGIYKLIDELYLQTLTKDSLVDYVELVVVGILLRFVIFGIAIILSHKGAYNTLFSVRCMLTEHMAKMPLGALNERNSGEMKVLIMDNVEKLELFLAHHLPELIYYLVGPIAIFVYLLTVNKVLALVSLLPLFVVIFIMMNMFKRASTMMKDAEQAMNDLTSTSVEFVQGMKTVKAFHVTGKSYKKYNQAIEDEHNVWVKMSKKLGPLFASYIVFLELGLVLLVPVGGYMFLQSNITASTFILFAFVGSLYLTEIRPLQELASKFAQVMNAVTKIKEILDINIFQGEKSFPKECGIKVENVDFSYEHNKVLTGCNLSINKGESLAIVCLSGAGKSTLVQLISRFYDVESGRITIGEVDIRQINYNELLENISIVFQKTFLMRGSIYENLTLGRKATLEEVREAAKKAQIDDFIMSLPKQYDTEVGGYDARFSGGEKQRMAIARAILKNAPLLILDEATSAADPENQEKIDEAIRNLCVNKTVIIVAHRLGIVRTCDKVAVVNEKTVTHVGRHEEVLETSKYYKKAWETYGLARELSYKL